MFRSHLTYAILFSITLMSGALWVRSAAAKDKAEIEAILIAENTRKEQAFETISKNFLANENFATKNNAPLSETDLIGRQLFSEYITLSSKGQATPNNLNILAEKYAQNIMDRDEPEYIVASQIKTTADTEENLRLYGNTVFGIKAKYSNQIKSVSQKTTNLQPGSADFVTFMNSVSDLYKQAGEELRNTPVPLILKDNHLRLVNIYLSSSGAAKSLSNIGSDPLGAYAAINLQAKNSEEEASLFGTIESAMRINGVPLSI